MRAKYWLDFKGERIRLFDSPILLKSENELIDEIENGNQKVCHLIDLKVRLIFGRFETKNHESSSWQDNLKTLLAHGFDVSGDIKKLEKSFHPLQFELRPNGLEKIHFGYFHILRGQSIPLQFVRFCRATEYPPDIHKEFITQTLLKYGGELVAIENSMAIRLLSLDRVTGDISALSAVFDYLSEPKD